MSAPAPKPERQNLDRLSSPADMAESRFGKTEGLAVVHKTTLELAAHYADSYALESNDPDVTVLTAGLAFARHKEFLLMQQIEKDLCERVMNTNLDYAEALFKVTKSSAHRAIYSEITRLHSRAEQFHKELKVLSAERSDQASNKE